MKITAINNSNKWGQNNKQPKASPTNFQAKVTIYRDYQDNISGDHVYMSDAEYDLAKTIKPKLEKLHDNVVVKITPAKEELSLRHLFCPQKTGLKFDLSYFDGKRFYQDVIKDKDIPKYVHPDRLTPFKNKVRGYLNYVAYDYVGVGKFYSPQKGETKESYIAEVMPKIKEHLKLLPKFLLERSDLKEVNGDECAITVSYKIGREPWHLYRGIDFDYPPVFEEYYKQ